MLVFLALAAQFPDRPIYAFRARGFEQNEPRFESFEEAMEMYHRKSNPVGLMQ